ncbi:MAG: SPOR domain-containing protein, partial [Deltaproteobacteria bacterium]|nr:SPOR domain-containing protein [Deltaproteobacteria bacterium]
MLLFILLGGGEAWAEAYDIQIGIFKQLENARLQYTSIFNALSAGQRNSLRIEKIGTLYAVRIGRFETQAQAEALLPLIKTISPEAFVRKGEAFAEEVLNEKPRPPASLPDRSAKIKPPDPGLPRTEGQPSWKVVKPLPPEEGGSLPGPASPNQPPSNNGKTSVMGIEPSGTTRIDAAIPANRAWLWGSIREISPLPPEQLGLKPGKEIFRLILQVEKTGGIAGYPNLLTEKEGNLLTVFSESNPPSFKVGGKIKAVV